MSHFITQNGLVVGCDAADCSCNVKPTHPTFNPVNKPATAGAVDAFDEERWFSELCDAIEEYLHLYAQHRESPKADREDLELKMHEAKTDVVARFYAQGWGK
ncbi:MAG: hypothetical protein M3P04_00440 [Actinomycetota bacterium]|nr:hypothetical protein [Actinomycetota bacterium]